jgi:hypothetical protein
LKIKILVLVFIILIKVGYSQNDTIKPNKKKLSFGLSHFTISNINLNFLEGINQSALTSFKIKNHQIFVGPTYHFNPRLTKLKFDGLMFSYHYNLETRVRRIYMIFVYDFIYNKRTENWNREMSYGNYAKTNVAFESEWKSLQNLFGYGFKFCLKENFSIISTMSIGGEIYSFKSKTILTDYPNQSNEYSSSNLFENRKNCNLIKLGFEYFF